MTADDRLSSRPLFARRDVVAIVVTVLAFVAVVAVTVPALRVPGHVGRVTVDNPHPWDVDVGADDDRHLVGAVDRETRQSFVALVDQGGAWSFTFTYAGERAEVRVSADQLRRDGWTVAVPDSLAADLRSAGIAETPH